MAGYPSCMARRSTHDPLQPKNASRGSLSAMRSASSWRPRSSSGSDLRKVLTAERYARIAAAPGSVSGCSWELRFVTRAARGTVTSPRNRESRCRKLLNRRKNLFLKPGPVETHVVACPLLVVASESAPPYRSLHCLRVPLGRITPRLMLWTRRQPVHTIEMMVGRPPDLRARLGAHGSQSANATMGDARHRAGRGRQAQTGEGRGEKSGVLEAAAEKSG